MFGVALVLYHIWTLYGIQSIVSFFKTPDSDQFPYLLFISNVMTGRHARHKEVCKVITLP